MMEVEKERLWDGSLPCFSSAVFIAFLPHSPSKLKSPTLHQWTDDYGLVQVSVL